MLRGVALLGTGAAVLTMLAGGVVAPSLAFADTPSISFTSVDLFNPTDSDSVPGFLQAQIFVTYSCPSGSTTTPELQANYGPASQQTNESPANCDGTTRTEPVFVRLPDTYGAKPLEDGSTYTYHVSVAGSDFDSTDIGTAQASSSGSQHQPRLTDMFPPYHFQVRRSPTHKASRAVVSWDAPLTTGSHTLTGFDVRDPDINVRKVLGPSATQFVVKHLKSAHRYSFVMSALASDFATSTPARSVTTAHKATQHVFLHVRQDAGKITLVGHVRPRHSGHVELQRRVGGHWLKAAQLRLHRGRFHHTIHPGSDGYVARVVASGTPDFKRSTSAVVTAMSG